METKPDLEDVIKTTQKMLGWERSEVVNVMTNVRADTPEKLMSDIGDILEWCRIVEQKSAMVDLMKMLPKGVLEIQWVDGEVAMRLSPELDVRIVEDGYQFDIPDPKAGQPSAAK
jgi:hypothetical protein